jgi:hypothetical protein
MTVRTTRRGFLLRGALAGGAVAIGLPLLDRFLDGNGEAMAATLGGGRLPVRFGTWFWGCGMIPSRWEPKTLGADYDLPPELAPIKGVQQHVSVLTGYSTLLDGGANQPHITGNVALRTGTPRDSWQQIAAPTLDVLIADQIGSGSYFRALDVSADGNPRTSYSFRDKASMNAAVPTAQELYAKVFGADFQDPNAAEFKPDVRYMVRKSVLTGVTDERRKLVASLGAEDRQRMDQYFTSIREVEQKLALQLQPRPTPVQSRPRPPASSRPWTSKSAAPITRRWLSSSPWPWRAIRPRSST